MVERVLTDLAPLGQPVWLVLDDLHELRDRDEARRQLELLVLRAPRRDLRLVLATRHDVRLGLHRLLRLEGKLTEIRSTDLRFTVGETRQLLSAAGVRLPDRLVALLVERTEGWAAGLRLAALSLAGHPDPEGVRRGVLGQRADGGRVPIGGGYFDRQPDAVRRLLLRTSILERVNGELADLLTGGGGGEGMLQELEEANAFVVSLDAARSWFRYHHLFAGMLQLELRRTDAGEVTELHRLAAAWLAGHGYPVEAVRHGQAAQDFGGWQPSCLPTTGPACIWTGEAATVHALLAEFPATLRVADAELAALAVIDELEQGSMEAAEAYLALAERGAASVRDSRRGHAQLLLAAARLFLAGRTGDQRARAETAQRLLAAAQAPAAAQPGLGEELRALALLEIGDAETWTGRLDEAQPHLEQAIALARRIGRPYLEFMGLTYRAEIELNRRLPLADELSRQAVGLADRHGWTDDLFAGFASMTLGSALTWRGQLDEAETWVERAERTFRAEANPAAAMGGHYVRGQLELARGRFAEAVIAFRTAERLAGPHPLARPVRTWLIYVLAGLGEYEQAEHLLAALSDRDRGRR